MSTLNLGSSSPPGSAGNVVGPASAGNNSLATYSGSTGKLIQDSGVNIVNVATLASPALTGTPTAPTAATGTNTTQLATTAGIVAERTATATITGKTISGASNTITNIPTTALPIQSGWGFTVGIGQRYTNTVSVTFPTAFSSTPVVVVTAIGYKDSSDPTSIGDLVVWNEIAMSLGSTSTTGFQIKGMTAISNIGTSRRVGYSWIAIG